MIPAVRSRQANETQVPLSFEPVRFSTAVRPESNRMAARNFTPLIAPERRRRVGETVNGRRSAPGHSGLGLVIQQ
jgi:hypothetical protein